MFDMKTSVFEKCLMTFREFTTPLTKRMNTNSRPALIVGDKKCGDDVPFTRHLGGTASTLAGVSAFQEFIDSQP
jgi:hypothetical protein